MHIHWAKVELKSFINLPNQAFPHAILFSLHSNVCQPFTSTELCKRGRYIFTFLPFLTCYSLQPLLVLAYTFLSIPVCFTWRSKERRRPASPLFFTLRWAIDLMVIYFYRAQLLGLFTISGIHTEHTRGKKTYRAGYSSTCFEMEVQNILIVNFDI